MPSIKTKPKAKVSVSPEQIQIEAVRTFWNNHIHDWKIAKSPAGTKGFFEEIEAYRFEKLHYLPRLVNFNGYRNKSVLDVGCGVGNDLARFAKGGAKVTGIDLAQHSIELAQTNFSQRNMPGRFFVMDGEQMTFPSNHFDMVYCHTVLHFTPHPQRLIKEICRVLKPGGTAIIMTVNKNSWLNFMHRWFKVKIDHLDAPVFHKYSIKEFTSMLSPYGRVKVIPERFPVPTKVHGGLKGKLFNAFFVTIFNFIPQFLVRPIGHHLMGFIIK